MRKLNRILLKKNKFFIKFRQYVMRYWRPNTEAYIQVIESCRLFKILKLWSNEFPDISITIGPYKNIKPYSPEYFIKKNNENQNVYEFLFLYDEIIREKITARQLTLGREDFVDLS